MAAASAAAILASCSVDSQSVIVTNDSELSRENETVELCFIILFRFITFSAALLIEVNADQCANGNDQTAAE